MEINLVFDSDFRYDRKKKRPRAWDRRALCGREKGMMERVRTYGGSGLRGLLCVLFCLALFLAQVPVRAEERETIRVAFIDQNGLSYLDEDGKRAGYDYEYLQEIAQYTGWTYEFVEFTSSNEGILAAMEQLRTGSIDLMTSLIYMDSLAEDYDYAAYSHGSVYTVLGVFEDNTAVTESNLFQHHKLRVAVHEKAMARVEETRQFCAMSGVVPEFVFCENLEAQREAVRTGRADVLLEIDQNLPSDMRTVAKFAPRPFYFASTKDSGLISQLNAALLNIDQADPYFSVGLYEKYFASNTGSMTLTEEEKAYIRGADTLRVAVPGSAPPIQTFASKTGELWGISRDIFDYISAQTGLTFEFVPISDDAALKAAVESGTVDLVAGIPYDYGGANLLDMAMSRPYLSFPVAYVVNNSVSGAPEKKLLALPPNRVPPDDPAVEVVRYDTVLDCLDAVARGEAYYTANSSYVLLYYMNERSYSNLTLMPQPEEVEKLCIGVRKPVNVTLLTILNKAVRSLPDSELHDIVYRNVAYRAQVTLGDFIKANPVLCLGGVLLAAAAVLLALVYYYRTRIRLTRAAALESERYRQLAAITNEHIFEYDYVNDVLTMNARSAGELGCPEKLERFSQRFGEFFEPRHWKQLGALRAQGGGALELECKLSGGMWRWFRITLKVICAANGSPRSAIGKLTDIQSEREEMSRLEERAKRDSLTGLYNAAAVRRTVSELLTEEAGGAFLVLDVDYFKKINDVYGHFEGDQVLTLLAGEIERTFRREDILGRLGGDEFVVFMRGVRDRSVVEAKCRLLLEHVKGIELSQGGQITLSVGAEMAEEGIAYDQLYQRADQALYEVKNKGKNGFLLRD